MMFLAIPIIFLLVGIRSGTRRNARAMARIANVLDPPKPYNPARVIVENSIKLILLLAVMSWYLGWLPG